MPTFAVEFLLTRTQLLRRVRPLGLAGDPGALAVQVLLLGHSALRGAFHLKPFRLQSESEAQRRARDFDFFLAAALAFLGAAFLGAAFLTAVFLAAGLAFLVAFRAAGFAAGLDFFSYLGS